MTKDGYYTSVVAKKADVTLKRFRYYGRQGILQPSKVADNGYRLYTDADFAQYQKNFSLENPRIFFGRGSTTTTNHEEDQDFIKESIGLHVPRAKKKWKL